MTKRGPVDAYTNKECVEVAKTLKWYVQKSPQTISQHSLIAPLISFYCSLHDLRKISYSLIAAFCPLSSFLPQFESTTLEIC